ncbi:hypothetical protein EDB19DRAFT_1902126 [Suillus lakei]|nr:hypothetical protein EDB19DRAFT_1902126 [Suillus lakei]
MWLTELFHLETRVHDTRDLLRLASLTSLKSLHFDLTTYEINETQLNFIPTNFSQLDEVRITAPSRSILNHCLKNVRYLSCRSLNVSINLDLFESDIYSEVPYDPLEIADIVSLSECFSPALEKLDFGLEFEFVEFDDEYTLASPWFALGFDVIAPLLPFSRLTDLRLDWICTSAIDDASLKTIAQSWPHLESFWFGGAIPWLIPPSLTFI